MRHRPISTLGRQGGKGDEECPHAVAWLLLLSFLALVSVTRGSPIVGPTSSSSEETDDLVKPCPGTPDNSLEFNTSPACDNYPTTIVMLLRIIDKMRQNNSGLAESECLTMRNSCLITVEAGNLTCLNAGQSDILAHKAIVSHQAYVSVLRDPQVPRESRDPEDPETPSFTLIKEKLKEISCSLMCYNRSLNETALQEFATATSQCVKPPTQNTDNTMYGCIVLRSLEQTLNQMKAYYNTTCH